MATVLYFGRLTDITGCSSETITIGGDIKDTSTLRTTIDKRHNAAGGFLHPTVRIAINGEIATNLSILLDTDEIAFMPPVGGG